MYAAAFKIDCNNERRAAHGEDRGHELGERVRIRVVAGEEDDSANERMPHQLWLFRGDSHTLEIDHQRPQANGVRPFFRPGSRIARDSTCVVWGNMSITPAATRLIPCSLTFFF